MTAGIVAYGAYVPHYRLDRAAIRAALGSGGGKGSRAVASYDEDSTSMAVEAARVALAGRERDDVRQLFFTTATPPYLDKTNATAVHAALNLADDALAVDMAGAVRSGVGAFLSAAAAAASTPTLAVAADVRTGLPGGADESGGGDGAAAFLLGSEAVGPVLAEVLAHASATEEFLERWRLPGATASRGWEERFGEEMYVPLADAAIADALKAAALTPDQVDHLVVAGLHARAVKRVAASVGARPDAVAGDLTDVIGNSGAAQPWLLLTDALDRAQPGQTILLVVLADGATAIVLRATDALPEHRSGRPVRAQAQGESSALTYANFLTWRGFLDRETPRRPDPAPPYAPPAHRRADWKFGFVGSRCTQCGTRHLPPGRVCLKCHAVDEMAAEPLADVPGVVATYTIDRLAYSLNPPMLIVVVDYDGGGRFRCELTDASEDDVAIGLRVEMTFRRVVTAGGVHNYFWKARPARTGAST